MAKNFVKPMIEKNHGHVVTIASIAGKIGGSLVVSAPGNFVFFLIVMATFSRQLMFINNLDRSSFWSFSVISYTHKSFRI